MLDPGQLLPEYIGKRQPTGWGYTDFVGESNQFLGLAKVTKKIDKRNEPIKRDM